MAAKKKYKKKNKKAEEPAIPQPKKKIQSKKNSFNLIRFDDSKTLKFLPILFIVLGFLLYSQCIPFGFVLDDKIVISENEFTKKGFGGISDILTKETFQGYFGEQKDLVEGGRYRPLSLVTFATEVGIFGMDHRVMHVVNILLYGFCCWLVFLVMYELLGSMGSKKWWWSIPFITALIYAVHPVHTEAVANIKGRDEILAMIFALISFWTALKYYDKGSLIYLLFLIPSFFLGLLSKENVITFLAVIPIGIFAFRSLNLKRILTISSILFGIILLYLFTRYNVIGYIISDKEIQDVMNNPFFGMEPAEKYGTISYTLFEYLRLSFVPYPLTHDYYPYHIPKVDFSHWKSLIAIIVHVGLFVFSLIRIKKNRILSFSILFYLATISIVSNVVVSVGTFMNERFIFMASMGVCLILAWLLVKVLKEGRQKIGMAICALAVVAFGILTIMRVPVWEDAMTLNRAAIKVSKNSARANSFMGTALFNEFKVTTDRNKGKEMLVEANGYIDKSLEILPHYSNANLMKAGIEAELFKINNDLPAFLAELKPVISRKPSIGFISEYCEYMNGRQDTRTLLDFYYDVGYNILNKRNRNYRWAIHYLKFGYSLDQNDPNIRKGLYESFMAINNPTEANKYR